MSYATEWEREYDERTAECVEAAITVALEPKPRTWPISGPEGTWNPDGHPLSYPIPPEGWANTSIDGDATPTPSV